MKNLKRQVEEEIQLNLTPMMDLFVALIPFLIMSASFTQLGGIDLQAPSSKTGTPAKIEASNDLWLMFEVKGDQIHIQGYDKDFNSTRAQIKGEFTSAQTDQFQIFLSNLEAGKWKMGPSLFHASPETKYEQAILFLNTIRGSKNLNEIVMASGVVE